MKAPRVGLTREEMVQELKQAYPRTYRELTVDDILCYVFPYWCGGV